MAPDTPTAPAPPPSATEAHARLWERLRAAEGALGDAAARLPQGSVARSLASEGVLRVQATRHALVRVLRPDAGAGAVPVTEENLSPHNGTLQRNGSGGPMSVPEAMATLDAVAEALRAWRADQDTTLRDVRLGLAMLRAAAQELLGEEPPVALPEVPLPATPDRARELVEQVAEALVVVTRSAWVRCPIHEAARLARHGLRFVVPVAPGTEG